MKKTLSMNGVDGAAQSVGEGGRIAGYASVFWVVDSDRDALVPGAFRASLAKGGEVALLWQHRPDAPIGRILSLKEDRRGLHMRAELNPGVQAGAEAYALLKQGGLSGLSVGFRVKGYEVDRASGVRFITEAELWEVSIVTFPANREARVAEVKALAQGLDEVLDEVLAKARHLAARRVTAG